MLLQSKFARGVRIVALFEGAKGLLVLLAGFGLLTLLHRDVHSLAARLVESLHLNPANRYPRIFIDAADKVTDTRLWVLAATALVYAFCRCAEAYGLWYERRWAEWLAVVTGAIYLPFECFELWKHVTWLKVGAVLANLAIVAFMAVVLRRSNEHRENVEARMSKQ